ncbi:sensor histidine kinase [Parabacteroides sp.]
MNMEDIFLQKRSIILWISLLAGFFITSEDIMEFIELYQTTGIIIGADSIALLSFQCFFFCLFTWILLQINIGWQPKRYVQSLRGLYSLLVAALFTCITATVVSPHIETINEKLFVRFNAIYQPRTSQRDRGNRTPDRQESNLNHSPQKRYKYLFHEEEKTWDNNLLTLLIAIYTLSLIYTLSAKKEEAERNYEKLKNENLESQISALYNQINPHFFFNALNSLHALIAEGQNQKSLEYLSNLSNVFRYILQSEKKELVTLKEELAFLETYRFMLSVKYEEKLEFNIQIDASYLSYQLPVLSLLPLIENVIKHNEISARNPMRIFIYSTPEPALVIQNRKQPKLDEVEKVGIGLKNLGNRFTLLLSKGVKIDNGTESFSVSLPLKINQKSNIS